MTADEDGFLRAIDADPEADAPRLIYADWLDETGHGERAVFLRAEWEWGRDPGEGREAQVRMARLSLLAWPLDLLWLARVSLVGRRVSDAVRDLERPFVEDDDSSGPEMSREESDLDPERRAALVDEYVAAVREQHGREFGRRVVVSLDLTMLQVRHGGEWSSWEYARLIGGPVTPLEVEGVVETEADRPDRLHVRGDDRLREGLWVMFADFRDREEYSVCTDREHPLFAAVVYSDDCRHAWQHGAASLDDVFPTTLVFLQEFMELVARDLGRPEMPKAAEWLDAHAADPTPWLREERR